MVYKICAKEVILITKSMNMSISFEIPIYTRLLVIQHPQYPNF
jgi:hypothetical protein